MKVISSLVAGAILAIIPAVSLAATDTFTRVVGSGWGTADTGGAWTADASPASFSVGGTSGRLVLSAAGQNRAIFLASTAVDWDVKTDLSLDKAPVGGGSATKGTPAATPVTGSPDTFHPGSHSAATCTRRRIAR